MEQIERIRQMEQQFDKASDATKELFAALDKYLKAQKYDVLNIVSQIPRGMVTTYGHIAALAGWPSHSRMVGRTLRYTPGAEQLPCHRVVNIEGRTAPGWSRQRPLLEEEGVCFKANGRVDMKRYLWEPPTADQL